jgi:hypothetical protein
VGAVLDNILEGVAVLRDEIYLFDTLACMFNAVAVDARVQDGNLHGGIAGGDIPALRRIDIRIRVPVDLGNGVIRIGEWLPGIVQSPLFFEIVPGEATEVR